MILCLSGIAISYLLWALSKSFAIFILARFVGGFSKGNISLSMAILSDVTSPASRGKSMVRILQFCCNQLEINVFRFVYSFFNFIFQALVGIAFSVGFVLGPMIGALFAKLSTGHREGQWYALPASFAFALAMGDLLYFSLSFKESLPRKLRAKSLTSGISSAIAYINPVDLFQFNAVSNLTSSGNFPNIKLY